MYVLKYNLSKSTLLIIMILKLLKRLVLVAIIYKSACTYTLCIISLSQALYTA